MCFFALCGYTCGHSSCVCKVTSYAVADQVHYPMEEDIIHLSTTMSMLVLGTVEPPVYWEVESFFVWSVLLIVINTRFNAFLSLVGKILK